MLTSLRHELNLRSIPVGAVRLPGDTTKPMDGALRLRQLDDGEWSLEVVDYGETFSLAVVPDEDTAAQALLAYIDRPIPPISLFAQEEVDRAVEAQRPMVAELAERAAAGQQLIGLPAGFVVDRFGAIDGVRFYPLGTPEEERSLPAAADSAAGSARHAFITRDVVLVTPRIVAPWFGQRGGGVQLTLSAPEVAIRDLLVSGALERFTEEEDASSVD